MRCAGIGCYKNSNHIFSLGFINGYNYCLLQAFYLGKSDNKDSYKEGTYLWNAMIIHPNN